MDAVIQYYQDTLKKEHSTKEESKGEGIKSNEDTNSINENFAVDLVSQSRLFMNYQLYGNERQLKKQSSEDANRNHRDAKVFSKKDSKSALTLATLKLISDYFDASEAAGFRSNFGIKTNKVETIHLEELLVSKSKCYTIIFK